LFVHRWDYPSISHYPDYSDALKDEIIICITERLA